MSAAPTRRGLLAASAAAAIGLAAAVGIPMTADATVKGGVQTPPAINPQAAAVAVNPDAELIGLAGRVERLARRESHVRGRMVDAQAPIDRWDFANRPRKPEMAEAPSRTVVTDLSTESHHVLQLSTARQPDPVQVGADAAYRMACEAHQRAVEVREAGSRVPRLQRLADRMCRRLVRDVDRLTDVRPSTAAGLAAKAAALAALGARNCGELDQNECRLALALCEDAVRLHGTASNITGDAHA